MNTRDYYFSVAPEKSHADLTRHFKTARIGLNAELQRLREGKTSTIVLYCQGALTRDSVILWFNEQKASWMGAPLNIGVIPKSPEVLNLEERIKELTEKLKKAESEAQFRFMTSDLKVMAEIQNKNWITGNEKGLLKKVKLDISEIIRPNAVGAVPVNKAKIMGSVINPNRK